MTESTALQLADWAASYNTTMHNKAAAELRRLHAVNQELLEVLKHYADTYCEGWCKESCGSFDDCGGCKARAAIARAEGEA
jgi:hypothetical protein